MQRLIQLVLKGEDLVTAESTRGLIPEADLALIRSKVSIDELLRDYDLQLVEAGGGRLKALCPFHNEKTPSFSVNLDKQFYYCFGCQAGGSIFTFVQEYERVGFPEAAEMLARKAGVVLQRTAKRDDQYHKTLEVYDALDYAAGFYHSYLLEDAGAQGAREYLAARGMNEEMQRTFRLGCSPPGWDELLKKASAAGHSVEVLDRAGLIRQNKTGKGSGFFDEFRGKLIFPISDVQGRVIGFGARRLAGDDDPAKYRNTRETNLFNKSKVLYALPQSKQGIRREKAIVVVEGYTDALMAHQAGLDFFVASLGTAFTQENTQALKRYADRVYMIFDGDSAGLKAAERSIELLVGENLDVLIYPLSDGKDPCDAIAESGGDAFWESVKKDSVDIFDFKWNRTIETAEAAASPQMLSRGVKDFLSLVAKISDKVARRVVLNKYVERFEILGIAMEDLPLEEMGLFSPEREREEVQQQEPVLNEGRIKLLESILFVMISAPGQAEAIWEEVPEGLLADAAGQAVESYVKDQFARGGFSNDGRLLHEGLSGMVERLVFKILNQIDENSELPGVDQAEQLEKCRRDLRRWSIQNKITTLKADRAVARNSGDTERAMALHMESIALRRELTQLLKETEE